MNFPDWPKLTLAAGVLAEPTADKGRIVMWLPGNSDGSQKRWERISSVNQAGVTVANGLCSTSAQVLPVQQQKRGLFSKLFARSGSESSWLLPNGESGQQVGERRSDVLLVWPEQESAVLDEAAVKAVWPACQTVRPLARNLFVVTGIASAGTDSLVPPPTGTPREIAERFLADARQRDDQLAIAVAIIDLGVAVQREENQRSVALLEEAVEICRRLGDRALEGDALGNLGMAAMHLGDGPRALELFKREQQIARETGSQFAEKNALGHLGLILASARNPAQSIILYERALTVAQEVGDRQNEAETLWQLAIQHAELNQRELAITRGEAAIAILQKMGKPEAKGLADHLLDFKAGGTQTKLPNMPAGGGPSSSFEAGSQAVVPQPGGGPGLLRMTFTAAKAMAEFAGSGFKTLSAADRQRRLQVCGNCAHHTGVRCKVCGCFTSTKTLLPHEQCPIGKWPV